MASRLIWTEPAWHDLESHANYIARDSSVYASAFVRRVRNAARSLSRLPKQGRLVPELEDPHVREILLGNYRLIYEVRRDAVYVLSVVHGARDLAALLRDKE